MRGSFIKLAVPIALAAIATGCTSRTSAISDVSCLAFTIIEPSRADTAETLRLIGQHNAAWRALCSGP